MKEALKYLVFLAAIYLFYQYTVLTAEIKRQQHYANIINQSTIKINNFLANPNTNPDILYCHRATYLEKMGLNALAEEDLKTGKCRD